MHNRDNNGLLFQTITGETIVNAKIPANYQASHPLTNSFIAEFQGRRESQEDRFIIDTIPAFKDLSPAQGKAVLKETIDAIQREMVNSAFANMDGGSTLCTVVIAGKLLYTANVGDATAMLVVRDRDKKITLFSLLNTTIHHITRENYEHLCGIGVSVHPYFLRIMDEYGDPHVNIYRAMGDFDLTQYGLSAEPDIYLNPVEIPEDGDAFLINACDGLTERLSFEKIENFINEHPEAPLKDLPLLLANHAYNNFSGDNITVIVTPIEGDTPTLSAIFDGHSGSHISTFLQEHFKNRLENNIFLKATETIEQAILASDEKKSGLAQLHAKTSALQIALEKYKYNDAFLSVNKTYYESLQLCETDENKFFVATQHHTNLLIFLETLSESLTLRDQYIVPLLAENKSSFKKHDVHQIKTKMITLTASADELIRSFNANANLNKLSSLSNAAIGIILNTYLDNMKMLSKQLLGKYYYLEALSQIAALSSETQLTLNKETIQLDDVKRLQNTMDTILFSTYIDAYKFSRTKSFFAGYSKPDDSVARSIEKLLVNHFPQITATYPRGKLDSSLTSRILWYIGKTYPDLVEKAYNQLLSLKNAPQTDTNTTLFLNMGKLLGKLGPLGFEKCSLYFSRDHVKTECIHEKAIINSFTLHP